VCHRCLLFIYLVSLLAAALPAQHRVDPRNTYNRILCIVPIVGSGTWDDPKRPQYAPLQVDTAGRTGIIGYTYQASDDGSFALVEFVAKDPAALAPILTNPAIKVFVKGKHNRADIESEFKKYKKDIDLDQFGVVMP
jgi:hypothetical protein